MDIAIVTGSCGLVGSEAAAVFAEKGLKVVGIDNDMRSYFFGSDASTEANQEVLKENIGEYVHKDIDIRDRIELEKVFNEYNNQIAVVIHTAAQPSYEWASKEPMTDFTINANGTLNLLELTRLHSPKAAFIFTSTNKVYGDVPNSLPLQEYDTRFDLPEEHPFYNGINETMTVDQSRHSLYGTSKLAADLLVQEYGKCFDMNTVSFRTGCIAGPKHSGTKLHGFLAYLMKCCITERPYIINGYKGKQVRDNMHAFDLVNAFNHFYEAPKKGEVYNIGGGRENSSSVLEVIELCERITGKKMNFEILEEHKAGDHKWYVTDTKKFQEHYPQWERRHNLSETLGQLYENKAREWESSSV